MKQDHMPAWLPSTKRYIEHMNVPMRGRSSDSGRMSGVLTFRLGSRFALSSLPIAALLAVYVFLQMGGSQAEMQDGWSDKPVSPAEARAMNAIEREMGVLAFPSR